MATAVLLGGMIPGAQAASGAQEIDAELAYTCALPEGEQPVKVRVAAKVPESAQAGQAIQPEDVTLDLTLPEEAVAGLTDSGAATVSAETRFAVDVSQHDQKTRAEWTGTTADSTPLPGSGDLVLRASGSVPYVKPGMSGELVFKASALAVELALKGADGAPAQPASLPFDCAPDQGREQVLTAVDVSDGDGRGEARPAPSESRSGDEEATASGEGAPEVGAKRVRPVATDAPPCVGDPGDDNGMNAYVTGYANVSKLDGATKFPLACAQITQGFQELKFIDGAMHFLQYSTIDLDYRGKPQLPPTTGTFLTFGFMPTTATLEMVQIPVGTDDSGTRITNIYSDLAIDAATSSSENRTEVSIEFMLRLYDVKVNGVPLEVGNNCRTSRPFTLDLVGLGEMRGEAFTGYSLATGGELTGSVTLPPFSGCGVDEDLDSIFTASLSGVPNYVKQVQGAPCAAVSHPATPLVCTEEYEPLEIPEATR